MALERQGAGRGLMGMTFGPLLGIVGTRPERVADGFAGPFHEGLAEELVYANDQVDVDDVVRIRRGGPVIGVTFAEEGRRTIYFDTGYGQLARSLAQALPTLPIISFVGSNRDGNRLLIFAGNDSDPGRYYVYDRAAGSLAEIMLARPELEGVRLASVRPISYAARDGTRVPGYLTLPPGRDEARGLPAVVLPHGGPEARDEWGFDWLAQFFANQGYAVLQPNFRGSSGYGDAWNARNGFQGWRTSIGDITDGARWLVAEGIADPRRMAIVGWSYGGYAALQAGVTEPDMFRAIVAVAPVTDLNLLKEDARNYAHHRLVSDFVGSGPHVEQGSPLRNAQHIGAPVLLFHGTRDINVGVRHSQRMHRALEAAGKRSDFIQFEGLEHDLDDSRARSDMLARTAEFLAAAMR
jgi:dipeptidyl aminopeptidase/acylaminoacyl peptidase